MTTGIALNKYYTLSDFICSDKYIITIEEADVYTMEIEIKKMICEDFFFVLEMFEQEVLNACCLVPYRLHLKNYRSSIYDQKFYFSGEFENRNAEDNYYCISVQNVNSVEISKLKEIIQKFK